MPFGMVSGVSRMMGVLDGVMIVEVEGAVLGVNLLNSSATATHSSQITLSTCCSYLVCSPCLERLYF